jgi:hypothetical protein
LVPETLEYPVFLVRLGNLVGPGILGTLEVLELLAHLEDQHHLGNPESPGNLEFLGSLVDLQGLEYPEHLGHPVSLEDLVHPEFL